MNISTYKTELAKKIAMIPLVLLLGLQDGLAQILDSDVQETRPLLEGSLPQPWTLRSFSYDQEQIGEIREIYQISNGHIWFAGQRGTGTFNGTTWTIYDPRDGAPTATNTIIQDRQGLIWVGSESGISQFDGKTWYADTLSIGLPGPVVRSICEAADGTIWAGCGTRPWLPIDIPGGLAKWDGQRWVAFTKKDGLVHEHVNHLFEDRDHQLWIATDGGVSILTDDGLRPFSTPVLDGKKILTIYQDRNGAMYFGTSRGIIRYARPGETQYDVYLEDIPVNTVHQTRDGILWAFSAPNLYVFTPETTQWDQCLTQRPGAMGNSYVRMHVSTNDIIWLPGFQIVRFHYGIDEWSSYLNIGGPPYTAPDGALWFVHNRGGTIEFRDGNMNRHSDIQWPVFQTASGHIWCGGKKGIRYYDGSLWHEFEYVDTLRLIHQSQNGHLWFVGQRKIAVYDGQAWQVYTDDEWGRNIRSSLRDSIFLGRKVVETPNGAFWFLPELKRELQGYGILKFEEKRWYHYTSKDVTGADQLEPRSKRIYDLTIDTSGRIWAGTWMGLWRYDAQGWQVVGTQDRAPQNRKITRIWVAQDSSIWIGSAATKLAGNGVFHCKKGQWTKYSHQDGLAHNDVWEIFESSNGLLWFGTKEGASRFSSNSWITYKAEDGLQDSDVGYIFQNGKDIWLGKGHSYIGSQDVWWSTRYSPDQLSPETLITFTSGNRLPFDNVTVEWTGIDPWKNTQTEQLVFSWKLDDADWSPFSVEKRKTFTNLSSGFHTLQVRAMDNDGNIDSTAERFKFEILPPVWRQSWFLGLIILFLSTTVFLISRVVVHTRDRDRTQRELIRTQAQLVEEAQKELNTAHDMIMGLMPKTGPQIQGLDIASQCLPATHVSGDFFQFFERENTLIVSLADVTGHAMEAAIPVVMFSGILENQMETDHDLGTLYANLNRSLCRILERRTFICFLMGHLDFTTHTFQYVNAACPYPYHFQSATQTLIELQSETYPLGIRLDTVYEIRETHLDPGDTIIFCSDGLAEAENRAGEQLGYDRLSDMVQSACQTNLSAQDTIDRIVQDVDAFRGNADRSDDMTCVVLRLEA